MAIPKQENSQVYTNNKAEKHVVGVELNASVIETLSSTLYDYKIEAVIREYTANVVDSHTMAGYPDRKGVIHLPTQLEPWFSAEDFGTGLSEDELYDIFATFGKSNKRSNNQVTGSLGYGSKSFLSVADSMTVVTRKDGKQITALFFKDEDGMIVGQTQHTCDTVAENGTKVTISVDPAGHETWKKYGAFVLGAFRVEHECNDFGIWQDEYEETRAICTQVREKGESYFSNTARHMRHHRDNSFVLMGDVLYAIPNLKDLIKKTQIGGKAEGILNQGFYVTEFNIGDLAHAPSRERISLKGETKRRVSHRLNKDIIKYYRELMSNTSDGIMNSLYRTYHEIYKTELQKYFKDVRLPCTQGYTLKHLFDPHYQHTSKRVYGIPDVSLDLKGLFLSNMMQGYTYKSLRTVPHNVMVAIKNPCVVYSEKESGMYKPKETLFAVHGETEYDAIFYVEDNLAQEVDKISKYFGMDSISAFCADGYSPEKVIKEKNNKRGSLGIKEDYEVAARCLDLSKSSSFEMQKVDLSEEGVYYVDSDLRVEVKGIADKDTTNIFTLSTLHHAEEQAMLNAGVKKVVVRNLNTKGKIGRVKVKPLSQALTSYVKAHKKDCIRALSCRKAEDKLRSIESRKTSEVLLNNVPSLVRQKEKVISKLNIHTEHSQIILGMSSFDLWKTKMYEQEVERKVKLVDTLKDKVYSVKKKLPLLDNLRHLPEEDLKYYLKLEKVIK